MLCRALPGGLFASLALAWAGCGGATDLPRPNGERPLAPAPDQCALGAVFTETALIDTFDPRGTDTLACGSPEVPCVGYLNHDAKHSPGADDNDCKQDILNGQLVADSGLVETFSVLPEAEERCGAPTNAMHFLASNLSMCVGTNGRKGWGLGWEVDFGTNQLKAPIDASAWDGFSFWVKKGTGPGEGAIIVAAVDRFSVGGYQETDPDTGESVFCVSSDPAQQPLPEADSAKCDPFVVGVSLTRDWTFVAVRFADMRQKGFGMRAPNGLETFALARLQFLASAGNWDFWLDDIAFFKDP